MKISVLRLLWVIVIQQLLITSTTAYAVPTKIHFFSAQTSADAQAVCNQFAASHSHG